jgi:hypothetical protein
MRADQWLWPRVVLTVSVNHAVMPRSPVPGMGWFAIFQDTENNIRFSLRRLD